MTIAEIFQPRTVPIQKIFSKGKLSLFIKREDLVHPGISGNKFWKLYHNIQNYFEKKPQNAPIVTFGGAYSNHITAVAYTAGKLGIPSIGIIRGDELFNTWKQNPTLSFAASWGMVFYFVSRKEYQQKERLENKILNTYPSAFFIPEGGTNESAVLGIKNMLCLDTKDFNYICTAVGTGGTLAGLSKYAQNHQKILGFSVVEDDSIFQKFENLSLRNNFQILKTQPRGYGKFDEEMVDFINLFYRKYHIPLDPIYTGKMMKTLLQKIEENFFEEDAKILAFHTGGIQGVLGANQFLKNKNKQNIDFNPLQV